MFIDEIDGRYLELAHEEHEAWLRLYKQLEKVKAVTKEDARSSPANRDTDGTMLAHLIRVWGHRYADLREAYPIVRKNEEVDQ